MDVVLLVLAAVYGVAKLLDFAASLGALVLGDDDIARKLDAHFGIDTAQLVPKSARNWNQAKRRTDTWTPVFAFAERLDKLGGPTRLAALVMIGILFRSPILTAWQAAVVFTVGEACAWLAMAVALTAAGGITSTLVFYLVTLTLGRSAEGRAGHVIRRGHRTEAIHQTSPLPSLFTLPAVLGALLLGFASVYFALSLTDTGAFIVSDGVARASGSSSTGHLGVMQTIYFATTAQDVSPISGFARLAVVAQAFVTVTGVGFLVSAASATLRPLSQG